MSKARLVITAVVTEGRSQGEVARGYGVSQGWVSRLVARYRTEGEAAFEPRSRRPRTSPTAIAQTTAKLIIKLRKDLTGQGLDAGPQTIAWHLEHHHQLQVSPATISRYLTRAGLVVPEPKKRPKSSCIRFQAEQPNERWQSDFIHWHLADHTEIEIVSWLDDHSRCALSVTAHPVTTGQVTRATFLAATSIYGVPASTLTDNGLVCTTRFSGGKGGRNGLENELRRLGVTQKNGRPSHPPDPRQSRTVPANPAEMADRPDPRRHPHRTPGPARHLHRLLQHPAAPPLPAAPQPTHRRLHHPAQSHPRRPRHRHPRPGPHRPHRRLRRRHPPPRRQALPHRHRPDPRPNPHHHAHPGPAHPRHQRRHRRTAP
jgi:transposase